MTRAIALLIFVFAWQSGEACSCIPTPSVEEAFRQSGSIFDGTVVGVEDRFVGLRKVKVWLQERFGQFNHDPVDVGLAIRLRVHEVWKGPAKSELVVFTHKSSATCGYPARAGERYLVYAHELHDGAYEISLCSRTRKLLAGEEDAAVLNALSKSKKF